MTDKRFLFLSTFAVDTSLPTDHGAKRTYDGRMSYFVIVICEFACQTLIKPFNPLKERELDP